MNLKVINGDENFILWFKNVETAPLHYNNYYINNEGFFRVNNNLFFTSFLLKFEEDEVVLISETNEKVRIIEVNDNRKNGGGVKYLVKPLKKPYKYGTVAWLLNYELKKL